MKKGMVVKCKNIVCGKEIQCEIINPKYNNEYVEVKVLENFNGAYAVVRIEDVIVNNIEGSAKIEFNKYESFDMFEERNVRLLDVNVAVTTKDPKQSNILLYRIADILEANKSINITFHRCPAEINDGVIVDGFTVEYLHGAMADIKQEIKQLFKQAKKKLGIR